MFGGQLPVSHFRMTLTLYLVSVTTLHQTSWTWLIVGADVQEWTLKQTSVCAYFSSIACIIFANISLAKEYCLHESESSSAQAKCSVHNGRVKSQGHKHHQSAKGGHQWAEVWKITRNQMNVPRRENWILKDGFCLGNSKEINMFWGNNTCEKWYFDVLGSFPSQTFSDGVSLEDCLWSTLANSWSSFRSYSNITSKDWPTLIT